jgi:hypothetical protein
MLTGQADGWILSDHKPAAAPWVRVSGVLTAQNGQVAGVPVAYLHTKQVELTETRFTARNVQAGRTLPDGTTEAVDTPKLVLDWDDRFTCTTQIGVQVQDTSYYARTLGNVDPPFRAKVRTTEDQHRVGLFWGPPADDPSASSRFTVSVPKLDVQQVHVGGRPVGSGAVRLTADGPRIANFSLDLNHSVATGAGKQGRLEIRGHAMVEDDGAGASRFVATLTTLGLRSPQGFTAALPPGEEATLTVGKRRLQISKVRLQGKGANLLLQEGGFDESGTVDVTAEVNGTELQLFTSWVGLPDVTGRITGGKISVSGTLDRPIAFADLQAQGVTAGPIRNASLTLKAKTNGDRLEISKAELRSPQEGTFEVTGNLPPLQSLQPGARLLAQCLSDDQFRLWVKGTGVDLGRLLNGAGLADDAVATAPSLIVNLRPAKGGPVGSAEATITSARLFGRPMAAVVRLKLDERGLHIESGTNLRIDGGSAFARGTIPRPATAELDDWLQVADRLDVELGFAGLELKHLPLENDTGEPLFSDGRSAGRLAITGTLAAPVLRGGVELDDARVAQLQRLDARMEFHTQRNGRTELLRISKGWLRGLGIDTELHGTVPVAIGLQAYHPPPPGVAINPVVPDTPPTHLQLRPWSDTAARGTVIAQLHDAQLRLFTEQVSGIEKLRGLVRGSLNTTLRWGPERNGRAALTYAVEAELEAHGVTYPGIRHGQLKFEGRVTERGVEQARIELDTDKGLVVAQGGLTLDTPGDWGAMLADGAASVEARIVSPSVDLSVLQPALEPHLRAAGGAVRFPHGIFIRGPMQSPQMDGEVELAGIQFASGQSGLPEISRLRGVLRFAGSRVVIGAKDRIRLRLGGGDAQLWGAVTLRNWSWRTLDLQLRADQSRILTTRDLSLVADLMAHPSAADAAQGGLRLQGRYDPQRGTVIATLRGMIVVDGGRYTQDYRTRRSTGAGALDIGLQVPGVEQLEYDLLVRTRRPLEIRNNIAATRVHVGTRIKPLRIFGDSRNPLLDGTINTKSGTAQLPIQVGDATLTRYKMTVRDVVIAFDPEHARDPLISGQLFFRYRQYEIQVVIPQGRLSLINTDSIRFSAQPPDLTQEQIRAILLVGVPTVASAEDAQNLVLVAATMAGLDLLVQTLFPGERGVVGEFLDRLTIEAASGDRLAESTVRAEFRIFDWLNIYGAREGGDTFHGGLGLKMSLPRTEAKPSAGGTTVR